jgi:hypothetical protein
MAQGLNQDRQMGENSVPSLLFVPTVNKYQDFPLSSTVQGAGDSNVSSPGSCPWGKDKGLRNRALHIPKGASEPEGWSLWTERFQLTRKKALLGFPDNGMDVKSPKTHGHKRV